MRRVLVVDDEENIRLVLRTLLKKNDYQVEVAESAEAAKLALVSAAQSGRFNMLDGLDTSSMSAAIYQCKSALAET